MFSGAHWTIVHQPGKIASTSSSIVQAGQKIEKIKGKTYRVEERKLPFVGPVGKGSVSGAKKYLCYCYGKTKLLQTASLLLSLPSSSHHLHHYITHHYSLFLHTHKEISVFNGSVPQTPFFITQPFFSFFFFSFSSSFLQSTIPSSSPPSFLFFDSVSLHYAILFPLFFFSLSLCSASTNVRLRSLCFRFWRDG